MAAATYTDEERIALQRACVAEHIALENAPDHNIDNVLAKTFAEQNLLTYGQEIEGRRADDPVVDVVLQPGQMSLHHMHLIHGSPANPSDRPRIGISINYLTPAVVDHAPQLAAVLRAHAPAAQGRAEDVLDGLFQVRQAAQGLAVAPVHADHGRALPCGGRLCLPMLFSRNEEARTWRACG